MYLFSELEGKRVKLIPLELDHVTPLFQCSNHSEIWTYYPTIMNTAEDMQSIILKALDGRERKEQFPFAVFDKELNEYVGSTRYLRISEENNNLSIGYTWYSPKVWRTRVNTECKYLLLRHAFDVLKTVRVEFVAASDNTRSQAAIERLGATREGTLRKKYHNVDYVMYSIIDDEWHDIKRRLESLLMDEHYS